MPVSGGLRRVLTGLVALGAQGWLAQGQILHAGNGRPSFEVATIKPWKRMPIPASPPDDRSGPVKVMKVAPVGGTGQTTNRVHVILPAALLIASAYNRPLAPRTGL